TATVAIRSDRYARPRDAASPRFSIGHRAARTQLRAHRDRGSGSKRIVVGDADPDRQHERTRDGADVAMKAETVGDYIAGFPKDVQKVLRTIRKTIRPAAPDAEESISYRIPTY